MDIKSLQLGNAVKLLLRTTPILLTRLGVALLFWLVAAIYLALTLGLAFLLARVWTPLGVIFGLIALGATVPLYKLAYRYVFFMIKAAHIAVISELLTNGDLPPGTNQLQWGKEAVQSRFGEVNVMFIVDELVEGVVRAFTNTVYRLTSWLPGDTLRTLAKMVNRVIRYATTYIDEAILARTFWTREKSVWKSAQDGVILYAMVWKPLLTNAVALMLLSYVPFIVAFVLFAAPLGGLLYLISPTLAGWAVLFALALAFFVKLAVGDAFAMAAMIAAYQRETAGLEPDPAMSAQLERVTDKFGELKRRGEEKIGRHLPVKPESAPQPPDDLFPGEKPPVNLPDTEWPPRKGDDT
jgi:hypothetical protein